MTTRVGTTDGLVVMGNEVRVLTLDRPHQRNALDGALLDAVRGAMEDLAGDPDVRAVVITGAGDAFSAGGDLDLIRAMQDDPELRRSVLEGSRSLFATMAALDVPVVAAVNGPAVGAGCTLALLSDVVFMADDTYLSDPHVRVGLVPGDGAVVLWTALAGPVAARAYLLSGDKVLADEARRLGLVHECVAPESVLTDAIAFAERLAALPPFAVRSTKRALNFHVRGESLASAFDAAMAAESASFDTPEHRAITAADATARTTRRAEATDGR